MFRVQGFIFVHGFCSTVFVFLWVLLSGLLNVFAGCSKTFLNVAVVCFRILLEVFRLCYIVGRVSRLLYIFGGGVLFFKRTFHVFSLTSV